MFGSIGALSYLWVAMLKPISVCFGWILSSASVRLPAAAHQPASDRCADEGTTFSLDVQIVACPDVLQSPRETPPSRFIALATRARIFGALARRQEAMADFHHVLAIDPRH